MSKPVSREEAERKVLLSIGMQWKPHQVRMLLHLLGCNEAFTAPELSRYCEVLLRLVYPFIVCLRSKRIVFSLPRPGEPEEWDGVNGRLREAGMRYVRDNRRWEWA